MLKVEGGQNRFGRVLFAASSKLGRGHLLYAGEAYHNDGPWVNPDAYRKWNGLLRFSQSDQQNGFSLTATAYAGRWNTTDQVPQRSVTSGELDRYRAIDPSDGGRSHRHTLAGEWRKSTRAGLTLVKVYAIDYGLDLFSTSPTSWTIPKTATNSSRGTSARPGEPRPASGFSAAGSARTWKASPASHPSLGAVHPACLVHGGVLVAIRPQVLRMSAMPSVGVSAPRREGPGKLTGQARYVDDYHAPGLRQGQLRMPPGVIPAGQGVNFVLGKIDYQI